MSCSPFDLTDYFLKELAEPERHQVEAHVKSCVGCRQELDRLRVTQTALFALREEEVPQRIAFVSDKIFEPSPWRRAWESFWGSTARLGFASAAMLSIALMVFALTRPAPAPSVVLPPSAPAISPAALQQQIQAAVTQAVAVSEARQEKQFEKRIADLRQLVAWTEMDSDLSLRQELAVRRSSYEQTQATNGVQR
jgi:anti-sigma factor RsiW